MTALHSQHQHRSTGRGYSLLELLIALAIAGIIAALANASYNAHVARARRASAQSELMDAALYLQRYHAAHDSYADAVLPAGASGASRDASTSYRLSVRPSSDGQGYLLTATPVAAIPGDRCGALTLTHTGLRGQGGNASLRDCWN